ncbi:hypothetical protein HYV50_00615 [Candidatus Pacearchaeota archaeon]|nr:hypothetical protein [Candidatus Pacearchaeota archaeon]
MIKSNSIIKFGICSLFLIIILSSGVISPGVASPPYGPESPLELVPGESKSLDFILQNAGGEDIKFRVTLTQGEAIARLTDNNLEYLVPAGRTDVKVPVLVSIPEEAVLGSEHTVGISVEEIPVTSEGTLQFATRYGSSFPVVVKAFSPGEAGGETEEGLSTGLLIGIAIGILVLLIIILVVVLKRRSKAGSMMAGTGQTEAQMQTSGEMEDERKGPVYSLK